MLIWHRENPAFFELFEQFTKEAIRAGHTQLSGWLIRCFPWVENTARRAFTGRDARSVKLGQVRPQVPVDGDAAEAGAEEVSS